MDNIPTIKDFEESVNDYFDSQITLTIETVQATERLLVEQLNLAFKILG